MSFQLIFLEHGNCLMMIKYRQLSSDEVLQKGDEIYLRDGWHEIEGYYCGNKCSRYGMEFRRPFQPWDHIAANGIQHGGTHYKNKPIEPWDYVAANGIDFFAGNAIKYLTRWKDKGGIEDLKKARHYIDKLIEIESANTVGNNKES